MSDEIPQDLNVEDPFVFIKGVRYSHDAFRYKFSVETSCSAFNRFCCAIFATECNPLNVVDEHIAEKRGFYPYAREAGDKYWTVKPRFVEKLIMLAFTYWIDCGYRIYNNHDIRNVRTCATVQDNMIKLFVDDQDFENVEAKNEHDEDSCYGWGVLDPNPKSEKKENTNGQ